MAPWHHYVASDNNDLLGMTECRTFLISPIPTGSVRFTSGLEATDLPLEDGLGEI